MISLSITFQKVHLKVRWFWTLLMSTWVSTHLTHTHGLLRNELLTLLILTHFENCSTHAHSYLGGERWENWDKLTKNKPFFFFYFLLSDTKWSKWNFFLLRGNFSITWFLFLFLLLFLFYSQLLIKEEPTEYSIPKDVWVHPEVRTEPDFTT